MQRNAIPEIAHDVITIGPEADHDGCTTKCQDPVRHWGARVEFLRGPYVVNCRIWANGAIGWLVDEL